MPDDELDDQSTCSRCGELYNGYSDGWEGECPTCADITSELIELSYNLTMGEVRLLYREWSERNFAAGWYNVTPEIARAFAQWVVDNRGMPEPWSEHEQRDIGELMSAVYAALEERIRA